MTLQPPGYVVANSMRPLWRASGGLTAMNTHPPKLVIFDCDGVLVDSEPLSLDVLVRVPWVTPVSTWMPRRQPSASLARA